ncbi:hypothetical protein JOE38_002843 [Clavibacter michiganensis]|nr:hypothetical protein [Clavibacter michiganensis]MBM7413020.1 hypothetical protein [Clavibacter michiganensis]
MARATRISAIVVLMASLIVLVVFQWLPALLFFPIGAGMLMWDGNKFSMPNGRQSNKWPK